MDIETYLDNLKEEVISGITRIVKTSIGDEHGEILSELAEVVTEVFHDNSYDSEDLFAEMFMEE